MLLKYCINLAIPDFLIHQLIQLRSLQHAGYQPLLETLWFPYTQKKVYPTPQVPYSENYLTEANITHGNPNVNLLLAGLQLIQSIISVFTKLHSAIIPLRIRSISSN